MRHDCRWTWLDCLWFVNYGFLNCTYNHLEVRLNSNRYYKQYNIPIGIMSVTPAGAKTEARSFLLPRGTCRTKQVFLK